MDEQTQARHVPSAAPVTEEQAREFWRLWSASEHGGIIQLEVCGGNSLMRFAAAFANSVSAPSVPAPAPKCPKCGGKRVEFPPHNGVADAKVNAFCYDCRDYVFAERRTSDRPTGDC